MDMDGMGHGGHSGHDSSSMTMSGGIFTPTDKAIAQGFWYGIVGFVALLAVVRAASILQARQRLQKYQYTPASIPSRPAGWLSQAYATATATIRELSYPQPLYFTGRFSRYLSPLPGGRWLLLVLYWTMILCFLWSNTILKSSDTLYPYKWEIIGFRAAWVTVTQIPLVYLLSCKFNPVSIVTGISYERFNWLHRWIARTVFLTAIVHWSTFYAEWDFYNMVTLQFNMMPMVKYGFGAWGIVTWMMLSGFGFFRALNYELFVLQHIVAAAVLLWALFIHVPTYARYNIWISIGFVAFDWGFRIVWGMLRNLHVLGRSKAGILGYLVRFEELPGDVTRLTINGPDFAWKAGQHAYITIPALRPFETHPFTISNAYEVTRSGSQRQLQMLIQARSGFSKSLHKAAKKQDQSTYRVVLSGPWGNPPDLLHYDTVLLIGCSTGASFVVPLLQSIVSRRGCVRTVALHWIIRSEEHFSWFGKELETLLEEAQTIGLPLQIMIHITGPLASSHSNSPDAPMLPDSSSGKESSLSSVNSAGQEKRPWNVCQSEQNRLNKSYKGRPKLDSMIRPAVEDALGETAVVVCGGLSVTAETRTYIAALSDERAVHKGTGAQGIFLFTETFGW